MSDNEQTTDPLSVVSKANEGDHYVPWEAEKWVPLQRDPGKNPNLPADTPTWKGYTDK